MGELTLEIKDLKSYYFLPSGVIKAVDGVSLNIEPGEALGIIGESGSGKSTIAWSIMRSLPYPGKIVNGEIFYNGKDILKLDMEEMRRIRWKEISMITQSALNAFDPIIRVGDQITEAIIVNMYMPKIDAIKRAKKMFENVRLYLSRFGDYPHELSGGMKQRVMIAMASACNPGLIIADEPTTALDVIIQAQILKLFDNIRSNIKSTSIIYISHDLSVIVELCDKIAIMYGGRIMEQADTRTIIKNPLHPYTKGLLNSFPHINKSEMTFSSIPGSPPNMADPPKGCMFQPRCRYVKPMCLKEPPKIVNMGDNHLVSCHILK